LYNYPQNRFVAGFIGSPKMNFLDATLAGADADGATVTLAGGIEARAAVDATGAGKGARVTLGVRPEHIVVLDPARADAGAGAATVRIPVDVALVEHLGEGTLVYVRLPGTSELIVCRTEGTTRVKEGQTI